MYQNKSIKNTLKNVRAPHCMKLTDNEINKNLIRYKRQTKNEKENYII